MTQIKHKNYTKEKLIDIAIQSEDCELTVDGALCAWTGKHTGRSPNAKSIVVDSLSEDQVDWRTNKKMSQSEYVKLRNRFLDRCLNTYISEKCRGAVWWVRFSNLCRHVAAISR